jgi:hypothetical protein
MRKGLLAGPIVAVALFAFAGTATAQDCFVVKRSFQGAISAGTHSKTWVSFTLEEILQDPEMGLCQAQIDEVLAQAPAAGIPLAFATRSNKVLLEGTGAEANGKTGDGKGIDHFEDSPIIGQLFGIIADVAQNVPCT